MRHPPEVCCPSSSGPTSASFSQRRTSLPEDGSWRLLGELCRDRIFNDLVWHPVDPRRSVRLKPSTRFLQFLESEEFFAPDHTGTPLNGRIPAALRGIHDVGQHTVHSISTSNPLLACACGGASSSLKPQLPFASPSAQCLPMTQQDLPNQADQWAWFLRDMLFVFLCWVVCVPGGAPYFSVPTPFDCLVPLF